MEYLFSAIIGWIVSNILNQFFFRARKTGQIIETLEGRLAEKDKSIEQLRREQKRRTKEKHHIVQALKRSGLSTDKLISKYDKPLNAILISYSWQEPKGFIKEELARYNSKWLGGDVSLIPPANIPRNIRNVDDLRTWFENEILKGRQCKIKFLILVDLKTKAYWNTYLPDPHIERIHNSIGERLDIEDLFTDEQIGRIALSDIIRSGDIAWLASHILSADELEIVHKNQSLIEGELGNPSLRLLSDEHITDKLSTILAQHGISNSEEVSKVIVREAKFWHSRLR